MEKFATGILITSRISLTSSFLKNKKEYKAKINGEKINESHVRVSAASNDGIE